MTARLDRRVDTESRQRVVNLEDRNRRVTRLMLLAQIVMAGTLVFSIAGLYYLYGRQQESRVRVLRVICETTNRDHQAIRRFVIERNPDARVAVERAFPLIRDCAAYAEREVNADRAGLF